MGAGHDSDRYEINPLFARLAELVLRFRFLVLLGLLGLAGFMAHTVKTKLRSDNTVESFADTGSDVSVILEQLRDDFGRDGVFFVLVEGDVFSLPFLERLRKLHEALAQIDLEVPSLGERKAHRDIERLKWSGEEIPDELKAKVAEPSQPADDEFADFGDDEGWGDEGGGTIIDEITSLINARRTRSEGDALVVGELLDKWPTEADLPALKEQVLADRSYVDNVVGRNGRHAVILLRTQFMNEHDSMRVFNHMEEVARPHAAEGFSIRVAGMPALSATLNELMLYDLQRLLIVALAAILIILLLLYRHPLGVIGPMLVVIMSVVFTLGAMALLRKPVTMITNILPAFMMAVGVGDSVHLISVYRDLLKKGVANRDAIIQAVGMTGVPIFFTTLTTVFGLLSFRLASMQVIADMGTMGAFGVTCALVLTMLLVPVMLSFNKKSLLGARRNAQPDLLDRVLGGFDALSGAPRKRNVVLAVCLALVVGAGLGMAQLRVWHNPLAWIPDTNETKAAFGAMDDELGGTANVALFIEANDDRGMKNLELMRGLEKLQAHIEAYRDPRDGRPIVGSFVSLLDIIKETHQALRGDDPAFYKLPDSDRALSDLLFMFENAGPDQLRRLATNDLSRSQMLIRLQWLDATAYEPLKEHIEAGIAEHIGDLAVVKPTGGVYLLLNTVGNLILDLLRSFGGALVVITILMWLLLRSVKLGLIAMIPNLLPIAFILGTMGWTDVPIDLANIIIASIILGIAVDDTIHFLHQFRVAHRQTGDTDGAIMASLSHSGRAIVSTSAILVCGFLVYIVASMINLQRFGWLIALAIVYALLVDLVAGPALLRLFYPRRAEPDSSP